MPWGQVVSHKNFLCVCGVVCFRVEFCQARLIPFFDRLAVVGGEIRIVIGFNPGEIGEALQIASRTPGCTGWRRGRNRTGSSLAWSRLPAPQSRGTGRVRSAKRPGSKSAAAGGTRSGTCREPVFDTRSVGAKPDRQSRLFVYCTINARR
jgi:hypothetical protein